MRKLLRVNMEELSVKEEVLPSEKEPTGGRHLTSCIVSSEVSATCHSLSAHNKLVLAPGWLGGTGAPSSGRLSVGAKSPLTGGIKESNSGGNAGVALPRLGIAGIVVEGLPLDDDLRVLHVTADGAELVVDNELKGLGNYDTTDRLREEFGENISCITIGQAGEMRLAAATIAITDEEGRPTRHAGRGGLGAVMGSKGLKAIVIDKEGGQRPESADREAFNKAVRSFAQLLRDNDVTGDVLPTYGTNNLAKVINDAGLYPTRNFQEGQFELVDNISGETQRETILARGGEAKHACHHGCTIACSAIYVDEDGEFVTKGPEYETIWAHGANCGIGDLDAIARMDRLDDDIGLDTIEMGAAIGVAMEGGLLEFGDAEGAIRLLEEVRDGTPLGRIIGSGAAVTGRAFGVRRVPVVKGQALPAYDPRSAKGIGVTYATSTMGADHTSGYAIDQNILKLGGDVDPLKPDGQVELSRERQIGTAALDATGLCAFAAYSMYDGPEALDMILVMTNAHLGTNVDGDWWTELGKEILRKERDFNARAGFTAVDDRLPDFFGEEPLPPHGTVFDVPPDELDTVFDF